MPTNAPCEQHLTVRLTGITAGDYLDWVYDPEPPALGRELCSITVDADPLGDRIVARLVWDRDPPPSRVAASAAGLALTPEVVQVDVLPYSSRPPHRSAVHLLGPVS